ncbi:uncharacterized protein LOC126669625 [Mercurialis annua]|uniref:uncharacterized protein LOC126669625 n=1 Tax=Mercurialis annua TaxID=3986 RepID=UPI00216074A5|nr:uncharacterized protein LOC126669625 [Mercurialis annua]
MQNSLICIFYFSSIPQNIYSPFLPLLHHSNSISVAAHCLMLRRPPTSSTYTPTTTDDCRNPRFSFIVMEKAVDLQRFNEGCFIELLVWILLILITHQVGLVKLWAKHNI